MTHLNKPAQTDISVSAHNDDITPIHKFECPMHQRMGFLPKYLGRAHVQFQSHVYVFAHQLIKGYDGGYWEFYHLTNGGFLMEWDNSNNITINSPNGSCAEVDTETASIVLNLMVLSELSFSLLVDADTLDKVVHCFHALREFALNHPNSATILKLID